MAEIMTIVFSRLSAHPKPPLCKGRWHGAAVTEGLSVQTMTWFYPAYPAGAYFSMKKSRQKSFRAPP